MKIDTHIDLTMIGTALVFIAALIIWGVRLEENISQLKSSIKLNHEMSEALSESNMKYINREMDDMRSDINFILEKMIGKMK